MLWLWCKLTGRKRVCLKDRLGKTYKTAAKLTLFGDWVAPVYWPVCVGSVVLLEDGTTTGESAYIIKWIEF